MALIYETFDGVTFADSTMCDGAVRISYDAKDPGFNFVSARVVSEKKLLGTKHAISVSYMDGVEREYSLPIGKKDLERAARLVTALNERLSLRLAEETKRKAKLEEEERARAESARLNAEAEAKKAEAEARKAKRLSECIYDFVVIDFETTGVNGNCLRGRMDEILSVAIVDQDGNVLMNELCGTEDRKTWKKAEEVHGITPAMVRGKPSFSELLPEVKEILRKAKKVVAYNIPFEMGFLWSYDGINDFPGGWKIREEIEWGLDPMLMFSAYKGELASGGEDIKWQKLTTATRHFKFKHDAHDSLGDAMATLLVYNKMLEYVAENEDAGYVLKYGNSYSKTDPYR